MKRILLLGPLLLVISFVQSEDTTSFEATGDKDSLVLPGDFNLFRCEGGLNGNSPADVAWFFKLANGNYIPVNKSDIGESHEDNSSPHLFLRESFIRINSPEVKTITCGHKDQSQFSQEFNIDFEDLMPIDPFETNHCKDGRKIIVKEWGRNFQGLYWLPHVVTNKEVVIGLSTEGLKLFCFSSSPVKWFIENKLTNFQYKTVEASSDKPCYSAELVISPLDNSALQTFHCGQTKDDKSTSVTLKFTPNSRNPDNFNQTQACVEQLGGVIFGNTTLGWTTAGGGLMSVLMMAGMVFLKRQLNQARNSN